MADIFSRSIGARRAVAHSPQNDKNDVSISYLQVKRLREPDLIGQSTDSIPSRALGCHLWPTFSERPAFTRRVVQALVLYRPFEPAAHCGKDRRLPCEVHGMGTQGSLASPFGHRGPLEAEGVEEGLS